MAETRGSSDDSEDVTGTPILPAEFIGDSNDVSAAFDAYCRPLVGDLPILARL